jgi:hypothetical protein
VPTRRFPPPWSTAIFGTCCVCVQASRRPAEIADKEVPVWKVAGIAVVFIVAACAESKKDQLREAQAEADAQAAIIARIDDAKCQSYGNAGSSAYVQCRASLKNERASMTAPAGKLK